MILQILKTNEIMEWNSEIYKNHVETIVIKINEDTFQFLEVPKSFIIEMNEDKNKRQEKAIKQYFEDIELWKKFPREMWNMIIYG